MVEFQIEWDEEALAVFEAIYVWYQNHLGLKAAERFRSGILDAIYALQSNPLLGKVEECLSDRKKQYRSLLEYSHHRIIYFVDNEIIYIVYIWDNRINLNSISVIIK